MMKTPNTNQLLDILRFMLKFFKIHEKINPLKKVLLRIENELKGSYQKSELPLFYSSPTTEAVGSDFITSIEPTALVVGERTSSGSNSKEQTIDTPYSYINRLESNPHRMDSGACRWRADFKAIF